MDKWIKGESNRIYELDKMEKLLHKTIVGFSWPSFFFVQSRLNRSGSYTVFQKLTINSLRSFRNPTFNFAFNSFSINCKFSEIWKNAVLRNGYYQIHLICLQLCICCKYLNFRGIEIFCIYSKGNFRNKNHSNLEFITFFSKIVNISFNKNIPFHLRLNFKRNWN